MICGCSQAYFCDELRRNAVPGVLYQKEASRNGVVEHLFPGIDKLTPPPLRPNFESLWVSEPIFFEKLALVVAYIGTQLSLSGSCCMTHSQVLQDFPDTSQVSLHKNNQISLKFRVFWDVAPRSHVEVGRCFRGAHCLHHHRPDDGSSTHI
jgi:hypothetical protein